MTTKGDPLPHRPASRFQRIIGLAGVAVDENRRARRWARRFEWPLLAVAVWIPLQWYLETRGLLPAWARELGDWLTWLVFLSETVVLTTLVDRKLEHLKRNWMSLAIIIVGFPALWPNTPLVGVLRNLRLLLLLGISVRLSRTAMEFLASNRLGYTLGFSALLISVAGVLISSFDPGIPDALNGIWWAWVTVTTVGYGDIVPVTGAGKFFASLIILLGIGLFALLTANISAFLVGKDTEKEEKEMRGRLKDIQRRLERIEEKLDRLTARREQDDE